MKYFVDLLSGNKTAEIKTYQGYLLHFWKRKEHDNHFWHAVYRQIIVAGLLKKEVESYGTLLLTPKGEKFMDQPTSFMLIKEHDFSDTDDDDLILNQKGGGALDDKLFNMLKDLRKA